MRVLFDPSLVFISDSIWHNETLRDEFISLFIGHCSAINKNTEVLIPWSTNLDEFLYVSAYEQPWISDNDWRNRFIPVLYRGFEPKLERIDEPLAACIIDPKLLLSSSNSSDIIESFCMVAHAVIHREENVFLCAGGENHNRLDGISFSCECGTSSLCPTVINNVKEWDSHLETNDTWPSCVSDIEKLRNGILNVIITRLGKIDLDIKYEYSFSDKFIDDIVMNTASSSDILYSISKRLVSSQNEASHDKGLKDEPVRGKNNERRFRVSKGKRIHYSYTDTGGLCFQRFYREGGHNDGL